MRAPYVSYVSRDSEVAIDRESFPGNLPFVADLDLKFECPVTFFVGENGSGKSTLLEAIAVLADLPIAGGGKNENSAGHGLAEESVLAEALVMGKARRARDGYFFRAELQAHFASLLDERDVDPWFTGDPYSRYGGSSLQEQSHGEAFLAVIQNRFQSGLFVLDEPESALSPQRQLALLALMHERVRAGHTQFIIATHSPILLTYPGARIISFDSVPLSPVALAATSHYQVTRDILNNPETFWRHLRDEE
jgi:predicted ATPase